MFSQLTRYASQLDIEIEDAEMDIRMTYDTRGKLLLGGYFAGLSRTDLCVQDPKSCAVGKGTRNAAPDRKGLPHDQLFEEPGSG